MALNFTPQKIKRLIEQSKMAEPYPPETFDELDGEMLNGARVLATQAQRLLNEYFRRNPDKHIEDYVDWNIFQANIWWILKRSLKGVLIMLF